MENLWATFKDRKWEITGRLRIKSRVGANFVFSSTLSVSELRDKRNGHKND
jgi:hypothetical protein